MSMKIVEIDYELTMPYRSASAKEGAPLTQVKNCVWLGLYVEGELAGITCAAWIGSIKSKHGRPRATYILPQFRRRGLYRILLDFALNYYKLQVVKRITAYLNPVLWKYWERKGFKQLKVTQHGYIYIERKY